MKCPKCGKEFKLNSKDKMLRKLVEAQAKLLFPVLAVACEEAKEWCNECWKERVKPTAEAVAGVKNE